MSTAKEMPQHTIDLNRKILADIGIEVVPGADTLRGIAARVRTGYDDDWSEWSDELLHLQFFPESDVLCNITLANGDTAEYTLDDYDPAHGIFMVEEYAMQIDSRDRPCDELLERKQAEEDQSALDAVEDFFKELSTN